MPRVSVARGRRRMLRLNCSLTRRRNFTKASLPTQIRCFLGRRIPEYITLTHLLPSCYNGGESLVQLS